MFNTKDVINLSKLSQLPNEKCLLTGLGQVARENIWYSFMTHGAKYFPVRPSHSVNKYIIFPPSIYLYVFHNDLLRNLQYTNSNNHSLHQVF